MGSVRYSGNEARLGAATARGGIMAGLVISGVHLSDIARRVELSINELDFVATDASGCGSANVANHVAQTETWCGVRMAMAAEDLDACARGLDSSVAAFTQTDQSLSSHLTPKAV